MLFDDLYAAAEYLIAPKNILKWLFGKIKGGSNGGLLVGATMTQKDQI